MQLLSDHFFPHLLVILLFSFFDSSRGHRDSSATVEDKWAISSTNSSNRNGFDPCCGYPCGRGVCTSDGHSSYTCDCEGTGYYGEFCQTSMLAVVYEGPASHGRALHHDIEALGDSS